MDIILYNPISRNGKSILTVNNLAQKLRALNTSIQGNRFAKCALQTALLDISAQRLGLPLSEILGGRLRNSIPILWVLASGDTQKDIAEARQMIDAKRHNMFKLKKSESCGITNK